MYLKFTCSTSINLFTFFFIFFCTFLEAQTLEYGDALTASISSTGETDIYTFDGNTGDIVRIRMRGSSQGVDGCFKLLSPVGNLLSEACDDGGIVQLTAYELPASGTYSIIAQDHNNNDTGDYGISLEVLNRTDGVSMVNCGDDILTTLDNWTEVDLFGFECIAGDQLMIQMRSTMSNVECRLELIDENGITIASEVTQTGLAIIDAFNIPADGRYVVAAYDGNGNDTGEYGISFQLLNQTACATPIECGATINNSFSQVAQIDAYTLNCIAGDQLVIRASDLGNALEPNIMLCDATGTDVVATVDPETAEINYNVTNSGNYSLIVRDDKGNDTGDYSLSLQVVNSAGCAKYLDCGDNAFATTLEEENEVDVYSFKANQGEIINVQMRGYLNGIDAFLKIYDMEGNLMASDYSNGSMAKINELVIPAEGLYTITAEDRNGNDTGEYGLSFQRVHLDLCPTALSCDNGTTNGMIEYFSEMDVYEFTGEAGQMVTFEMEEIDASLEPMIRFYAPDGTLLIEEHKSFHVDVTDYVLPQTGRYVLVCLDKNGNDTGAYTLEFNLNFENGTSVCSTCNDGIQNGTETGVDCGGPDCMECCPEAGTACDDGDANTFNDVADGNCGCAGEICPTSNVQCTVCPEDLVLNCSDLGTSSSASNVPMPIRVGGGGYDMDFQFASLVEENGACKINSIKFDNGCVGIRTACFGDIIKVTPDYGTCQGPLPELPFTVTFNDDLSVYFNENGEPSESSNSSQIANNEQIQRWLTAGLNNVVCNVQDFTHDFNPSVFDAVCDGENSAEEVSQVVSFKWLDLCNNVVTCEASLTIINDSEPPCPAAGTACNDYNPATENDVQDGNCNCIGTIIPPAPSECDRLDFSDYQPVSYGGGADQGNIQVIEDNQGYLLTNNAWKAVPFEYTITADTKLEFEFMSSQEGEIHGIGFENNLFTSSSSGFLFQLYGTQSSFGRQEYNNYTEEGVYKKYIIPVGEFYTGNARYMTFVMDDDAAPRDGNSLFRNVKVYEGTCTDEETMVVGCGVGGISRDVWLDIPGYDLNSIPWNTEADISDRMTKFEAPIDVYDHYGTRMSGYICPPQSGNYTFWISSDDGGELWLSTDEHPDNVRLIAEVEGWTYPQVWDKYTGQQSVEIYLEAGRPYYVEAFQKEHEGLDNLAVGWQWPNGTMERPILGAHLSPFTGVRTQATTDEPTANTNDVSAAPTTNSVNGNSGMMNISVFPNPATDEINVEVSAFIGQDISIQITNSFGQPIHQQSYDGLSQSVLNVDMSSPTVLNGLYNVLVTGADGVRVNQSFLIIR